MQGQRLRAATKNPIPAGRAGCRADDDRARGRCKKQEPLQQGGGGGSVEFDAHGHQTVGQQGNSPGHWLSGPFFDGAEADRFRRAGGEGELHVFRFVRERAEPKDGGLAVSGRLEDGHADAVVVNGDQRAELGIAVGGDVRQRLRLFEAKAVGGGGVIRAVQPNTVAERSRAVLGEGEIGVPVVVHGPGIDGGTGFELAEPGFPLPTATTDQVGRHGAIFKQRRVQRAPGDALPVIGDVEPTLQGDPIAVPLRPLVFLHLHHAPGDVHAGCALWNVEAEPEVDAILGDERQLVHDIKDFYPRLARDQAHAAADGAAPGGLRGDAQFHNERAGFGGGNADILVGLGIVVVAGQPAESVEATVDLGVGEIAAGGRVHEVGQVARGRVEGDAQALVFERQGVQLAAVGQRTLAFHHAIVP